MKNLLLFCGAAALLTLSASQPAAGVIKPKHPTPAPAASRALTPDEQLFTTLIGQVSTAVEKGDMAALGQYMTPDYVHYNPNGGSGTKAEELAYLGSWKDTSVKLVSPVKVMRQGNMAVTVTTSTFSGVAEGKPFKSNIQMMTAWMLRDGKWQMAVVQSKMMPA